MKKHINSKGSIDVPIASFKPNLDEKEINKENALKQIKELCKADNLYKISQYELMEKIRIICKKVID